MYLYNIYIYIHTDQHNTKRQNHIERRKKEIERERRRREGGSEVGSERERGRVEEWKSRRRTRIAIVLPISK